MLFFRSIKFEFYKIKQLLISIFIYPSLKQVDESYNVYWQSRDVQNSELNSFQKKRADLLIGEIDKNDSILDIGCGDGRILAYLMGKGHQGEALGVDSSDYVLERARAKGINVLKKDIRNINQLDNLPAHDVVILFEVLEHMVNSEDLLVWAYNRARKAVLFSVPNTGFIVYRLRLLLGRFPLQWRVHPSEHLRFWTLRDMKWWLGELGYKFFKLYIYEGVPLFNKFWPSLFGQGLFIYIPKR